MVAVVGCPRRNNYLCAMAQEGTEVVNKRQPGALVSIGRNYYPKGVVPSCGYVIDEDTREICGAKPMYIIHIRGYEDPGSACAEHAAIVRTFADLEEIKSI